MHWLKELFHVEKPIIGLLHLPPLPGDPFYPEGGTMEHVIENARRDLLALQAGGVDGVLITNEFSVPYQKKVDAVTIAAMAMVVGALKADFRIPYGVEAIYDGDATIEVCAATDAAFTRCLFTGAWAGDLGLIDRDVSKTLRMKRALGLYDLKLFHFVTSEGEVYLNDRTTEEISKSLLFNCRPDAFVVGGSASGENPGAERIGKIQAIAPEVPVFCGTGCRLENVEEILQAGQGAFVGTTLKADGKIENPIDADRVKVFMEKVRKVRGE